MDGLKMIYFVLKPKAKSYDDIFARASQKAMCAYADTIRSENPTLAKELDDWASEEVALQQALKKPNEPVCGCGYCDN